MTKEKKNQKKKPIKKGTNQVSKKKNDLKTIESELNILKDKHIRLKAEFENFRRRKSEEISKLLQFEGESVIKGFLPILDDINRMINIENTSEKNVLSEDISDNESINTNTSNEEVINEENSVKND